LFVSMRPSISADKIIMKAWLIAIAKLTCEDPKGEQFALCASCISYRITTKVKKQPKLVMLIIIYI
jgi:hypothetical protein